MSIRFRRKVKLAKGITLNLGKRGAGLSLGGRGARLGVGRKGLYRSFSIPGTGLYSMDYLGKEKKQDLSSKEQKEQNERKRARDFLPMPDELKEFNYPLVFLILGIVFLPFQFIVTIVLLIAYFYTSRRLSNSPKGRARNEFVKGKKALKNNDYRTALISLQYVLKNYPVKEVYPLVAELLLRESEYEEAVKTYQKYLEQVPGDKEIMTNYAISLKKIEEYDKAIEVLQKLLKEENESEDNNRHEDNRLRIISTLGDIFLKKEKLEMALEVLKSGPVRARKLDSQERMYFKYLLGVAYKKAGEDDRALTHLKRVYVHDKNFMHVEELINSLEGNTQQVN